MGITIRQYSSVVVTISERESEAVKLAVSNLIRDFKRVLQINTEVYDPDSQHILVGTVGVCEDFEEEDLVGLFSSHGRRRKEAYVIRDRRGRLVIAGSDRRGTVFGIYEFCRTVLGVSPWYFMADVPIHPKTEISLPDDYHVSDHPSIEYRGIFINDEEELDHWAQRYLGETTIGIKTYEKIFELMLRLKMNYLWPAMHVNAFNANPENAKLADKMGIVIGTSHCDMLMRSNNKEWRPWLEKKGYGGMPYDFTASEKSRDAIIEYWQEAVEQNKDYEVTYTLGMRGIHDSEIEPVALAGLRGWMHSNGIDIPDGEKGRIQELLAEAAEGKRAVLKEDFAASLREKGVTMTDQRLSYHLRLAEYDGLLCSGDLHPTKRTLTLVSEKIGDRPAMDRDEALVLLTRKYFRSHGPATLEDFVWWSGLNISDCRRGMDIIGNELSSLKHKGKEYHFMQDARTRGFRSGSILLLPAFDEYLIGYKSRHVVLHPGHAPMAHNQSGIVYNVIALDGEIVGNWRPSEADLGISTFKEGVILPEAAVSREINRFRQAQTAS